MRVTTAIVSRETDYPDCLGVSRETDGLGTIIFFMEPAPVTYRGSCGDYSWLVSRSEIRAIRDLIVRFHAEQFLCIIALDGGPIRPAAGELEDGWCVHSGLMMSPPLSHAVYVPHDGYDEWYIFRTPPVDLCECEVFVNWGSFTLAEPEDIYKSYDPTWEKNLDFLPPLQERFWAQIERDRPESYVASGDNDIVVSRNREFIESVAAAVG